MSHKRKGQLTVSGEWARHLRPYLRRMFWKGERQAEKVFVRDEEVVYTQYEKVQECPKVHLTALAEDAEDLTAFDQRKTERSVSFESLVRDLRKRGRI